MLVGHAVTTRCRKEVVAHNTADQQPFMFLWEGLYNADILLLPSIQNRLTLSHGSWLMVGFWVASVGIRRFHFSKLKASSSRCNLLRGQSSHDSQGRSGQKRKTSRLSSLLRCVVRGKGEIGILNGPFYIILVHFRSRLRMNHSRFNFGSRLKVETSRGDPVRG